MGDVIIPSTEEEYVEVPDENQDNGFADLAADDYSEVLSDSEIVEEVASMSRAEQMALLSETVTRQPLNRELMYKTLVFCLEEHPLPDVESEMATFPEFKGCTQNQFALISLLTRAGGLECIEYDEQGNRVFEEQKEGLTEDEIDDLVWSFSYKTTELGAEFVEIHSPRARIIEMMNLNPERKEAYAQMLEFISREKRSYPELEAFLRGNPALETVINGHHETMQPSVFVDKLERNGAVVWDNGWKLTKEGREYLEELKQ